MAREDLNPVEEARAVAGLVEELGLTREAVGKRVGRSRVAISNLLRILDLPDAALGLIEDGTLSEGHGRALLLAEDHVDRKRLATAAADGGWSVRVTEERARQANAAAADGHGGRAVAGKAVVHPDQAAAASEIADALGGALGTEVKAARAAPATRSSWPWTPSMTPWHWRCESAPGPEPALHFRTRSGRLAQSVRALL